MNSLSLIDVMSYSHRSVMALAQVSSCKLSALLGVICVGQQQSVLIMGLTNLVREPCRTLAPQCQLL